MDKAHNYVIDYLLTHPCVDCGETNPLVLDFDHVDDDKEANVSQLIANDYSFERIKEEIAKCEVRCGNCHRRVTAKRENWWIYTMINDDNATASTDKGE